MKWAVAALVTALPAQGLAMDYPGNESAVCETFVSAVVLSPSSFRVLRKGQEDVGNMLAVSLQYEAQNRFGVLLRDTATCFFNRDWYKRDTYSPYLQSILGPTPVEKVCLPGKCFDRDEAAFILESIETGRVIPRMSAE